MNKLVLTALLPLLLAACGIGGTPKNYDVSGTISGKQPSGALKMAVVGVSLGGVVNTATGQIAISSPDGKKFSVDYPLSPADGLYQVIAYIDADGNGKYNLGELRTANNNKYLAYAKSGGGLASLVGLRAGWNYVIGTAVTQPSRITDYDLSW
ncbi:hypothetical protein [Deinococcus sp.]|uniref:hypothetical protein n=1 Tax=Deinococcus sp. TaxID=47478 RepID=UPI0025C2A92C|nr:hypothetical protein [Deinococcus sp.]